MSEIDDFARLNVASAARDLLALLDAEIAAEHHRTDMVAYTAIEGGKLDPTVAYGLLMKKHALHSLQRRLKQKAQQGVSSATRLKEHIDGTG